MKTLNFTKMHGLGNDFIIVSGEDIPPHEYSETAKKICDRHFGIGADGLIIVNPVDFRGSADTSWRIINSDGSEPQMCGNGIRCFAKYVYDKKITDKTVFSVHTLAGDIVPEIMQNGQIRVNMGKPVLEGRKVPVKTDTDGHIINYPLKSGGKTYNINAVSMGNPHCVIFEEGDSREKALKNGRELETHEFFPEKTNVEFVKVLSRDEICIDVWERGCGITLACGTGACASVVAGILNQKLNNKVKANLPGGSLFIEWDGMGENVYMTGSAEYVCEGVYYY